MSSPTPRLIAHNYRDLTCPACRVACKSHLHSDGYALVLSSTPGRLHFFHRVTLASGDCTCEARGYGRAHCIHVDIAAGLVAEAAETPEERRDRLAARFVNLIPD